MKIIVSVPYQKNDELKSFGEGVAHLKKLGHNVFETYDIPSAKKASPSREALAKGFEKIDKAIKDTDILIAEVSNPDSKVGYEIARALDEKKVVIALEEDTGRESLIPVIHGNKTRTLIHKKYSATTIVDIINKSIKEAASKLDSKFILIISPEIDRYLEWSAQTKRMHKAQIVRNAVEQMMKKDREYKTYLQG